MRQAQRLQNSGDEKERFYILILNRFHRFVKAIATQIRALILIKKLGRYSKTELSGFLLSGYAAVRYKCPFHKCDFPSPFDKNDR